MIPGTIDQAFAFIRLVGAHGGWEMHRLAPGREVGPLLLCFDGGTQYRIEEDGTVLEPTDHGSPEDGPWVEVPREIAA